MSLWEEVRHHYEDGPEELPAPAFQRSSTHTARVGHDCEVCEGRIAPGQQYRKITYLDDEEGVTVWKAHLDRDVCNAERDAIKAARLREQAEWDAWAQEIGRREMEALNRAAETL